MADLQTTEKIPAITEQNEKDYAHMRYDMALKKMLADRSLESIKEFEEANAYLFEVEDAYRIGAKLLLDRAKIIWFGVTKWRRIN